MSIPYEFSECLQMSQGTATNSNIRQILMSLFPGALNVRKAKELEDRNGTDWWVDRVGNNTVSVDCKIRPIDCLEMKPPADDIALETFSVLEHNGRKPVLGWTRDPSKRTDYILWFWVSSGRYLLMPFLPLCAVFSENWNKWPIKRHCQQNRGYWSQCMFVERKFIWDEILKHMDAISGGLK